MVLVQGQPTAVVEPCAFEACPSGSVGPVFPGDPGRPHRENLSTSAKGPILPSSSVVSGSSPGFLPTGSMACRKKFLTFAAKHSCLTQTPKRNTEIQQGAEWDSTWPLLAYLGLNRKMLKINVSCDHWFHWFHWFLAFDRSKWWIWEGGGSPEVDPTIVWYCGWLRNPAVSLW
jgi:hypothetical protein